MYTKYKRFAHEVQEVEVQQMAKHENLNPMAGLAFGLPHTQSAVSAVQESAPEVQEPREDAQSYLSEETQDTLHNTQGRKGHKLPRINMAFTPENHVFVKRTARKLGITATEYVNGLIDGVRGEGQ